MDRDSFRDFSYGDIKVDFSSDSGSDSFYDNDDVNEVREARLRKFDTRASKQARRGSKEPRRKDKGYTRTSKEDRQNRY